MHVFLVSVTPPWCKEARSIHFYYVWEGREGVLVLELVVKAGGEVREMSYYFTGVAHCGVIGEEGCLFQAEMQSWWARA